MPYDHPKTWSANTPDAPSSRWQDEPPVIDYPDWYFRIQPGDVVSFRFPVAEGDGAKEAPKARPCLVLEIEELCIHRSATLAYGTTSRSPANRGYEIPVLNAADHAAAGLHEPTRFVGARRISVSLRSQGFVCRLSTGSPLIGRLPDRPMARLQSVRARLQAEHDMHVAHLAETRRERGAEAATVRRRPRRPALPVWRTAS